jgi:hypothetical protein
MADIKEISKRERRNRVAMHFESIQRAKELHRESNVKDRMDYIEQKLDGIFLILQQIIQPAGPKIKTEVLSQYPFGSYLQELTEREVAQNK